jgi:hypothetical protein
VKKVTRRRGAGYGIFFSCFFLGCFLITPRAAGQENPQITGVNAALNGSLYETAVFTGISGRMYSREKEREYAKLHIANQMAMYQKCVVDYGFINMEGTALDDGIRADSNFDYDDTLVERILLEIEILAEYQFDDFLILTAKNNAIPNKNFNIRRSSAERPFWIRSVPNIEGYYTGVGIGDKTYTPYKSIFIADITAAHCIAKEMNLYIQGFTSDVVKEGIENVDKLINGSLQLSKAELRGFYIIDRWIDADGACYSLGAAKKD